MALFWTAKAEDKKKRRAWLSGTYLRAALDVPGTDIVGRTLFLGDLLTSFSGLETSASYLTKLLRKRFSIVCMTRLPPLGNLGDFFYWFNYDGIDESSDLADLI